MAEEITVPTGVQTDLAILGTGYFVVRDPNENLLYVTRQGDFQIDENGSVVTSKGLRLQGYKDPALTEIGDLEVNSYGLQPDGSQVEVVMAVSFQSDGRLLVTLDDGTEHVRGQFLLQDFGCPSRLRNMGDGYYALEQPALPLAQALPPGTAGLGVLAEGQLEVSVPTLQLTRVPARIPPSSQGVLYDTGNPTDLAIEGRGFFVVRDPTNNVLYATRAGAFYGDTNGYLVNYTGFRVQGYTNADHSGVGDMPMDLIGYPPPESASYAPAVACAIDHFGKISTICGDGTSLLEGQILLRDCADPESLVSTNFGLYPLVEGSGLWTAATAPGYGGFGWLYLGMVEPSHFDEDILSVRQSLNFFVQGPIQQTTNQTDVAIDGLGLFMVRDPGSGIQYATRCGAFQIDANGYLVTSNGYRLQGLNDAKLSLAGDLVINTDGEPSTSSTNVTVWGFNIDSFGRINVILSDGANFVRGQVLLQLFGNPQALRRCPNQFYSNVEAALPIFVNASPRMDGLGFLLSPALEDLTPPPELQLPPQSGFRLLLSDFYCGNSFVETSSDCLQWTTLSPISDAGVGEAELFDTNITQVPSRFYRVRTTLGAETVEPAASSGTLRSE